MKNKKDFLDLIKLKKYTSLLDCFNKYISNIEVSSHGMFNSEIFSMLLLIKNIDISTFLEVGTGKMYTTKMLLKFLDSSINIITIDNNPILAKYYNKIVNSRLNFIEGDGIKETFNFILNNNKSYGILLDLTQGSDQLYIALKVLDDPNCKVVFIHDLNINSFDRNISDILFKNIFYTDIVDLIKGFGYLDKKIYDFYKVNNINIYNTCIEQGRATLGIIINNGDCINKQIAKNYREYYLEFLNYKRYT